MWFKNWKHLGVDGSVVYKHKHLDGYKNINYILQFMYVGSIDDRQYTSINYPITMIKRKV